MIGVMGSFHAQMMEWIQHLTAMNMKCLNNSQILGAPLARKCRAFPKASGETISQAHEFGIVTAANYSLRIPLTWNPSLLMPCLAWKLNLLAAPSPEASLKLFQR